MNADSAPVPPPADFWKEKLAAFLHDPPSKALDIANHVEIAAKAYAGVGLGGDQFKKPADWTAAAADRLPFPKGQIHCKFDGQTVTFRHPLTGDPLCLPQMTAALAEEKSAAVQPCLTDFPAEWTDASRWRAQYFVHWRNWREKTVENDWRLSFFPADTRIPDHSIWHHNMVVSAFAGCMDGAGQLKPAFLRVQIGPVQEFIAAAKSVRDLWSGSYLLSWLMAAGLKALSAQVGADSVIFPSLFQQPLFDLQWRDEIWSKVSVGTKDRSAKTVWEEWAHSHKDMLVPNLPNVCLALVPAQQAEELGALVDRAIRAEWDRIAESCWNFCDSAVHDGCPLTGDEVGVFTREERKERFDAQAANFLQVSWAAEAWPDGLNAALELASNFPEGMPIRKTTDGVRAVVKMATEQMDAAHRDERYYSDKQTKNVLNNAGAAWATILQFTNWKLDAVRQTRSFNAWAAGGWGAGAANNKDALNGKEEAVAGGREWCKRCLDLGSFWKSLFKKDDWVGASTLIKRVWHLAYLEKKYGIKTNSIAFPMPDTREIAKGQPDTEADEKEADKDSSEKYFAVLALDGDEIGKWVSGEKSPPFKELLAPPACEYFKQAQFKGFLDTRRPLSPGFHLQFSETLSNFALKVVPTIVAHFRGRLIYAGGDDVLAMLPADKALECAAALRSAFRGEDPHVPGIVSPAPGFLCSDHYRQKTGAEFAANESRIPFPVPGRLADVSVGIAMAHFKHPLQDVVREAQSAEKRAKSLHNRGAVAVSVFKRSGEILKWGCKWGGGGIELFNAIAQAMHSEERGESVSNKFPHRVCELITPYLNTTTGLTPGSNIPGFPADVIIQREFAFAALRQGSQTIADALLPKLERYLKNLPTEQKAEAAHSPDPVLAVIGLCRSVAFAHRTRSEQ